MSALIIIPTYNEALTLPAALDAVRTHAPAAHILVVDDSSPDGTGQLAEERAGADEHIHVLHRAEKNGLGPAYLAGFAWGLKHGYDFLVEMDADGSHRAEDLALLLERATMADAPDLVIGSRWVAGGSTPGWNTGRVALSRTGNLYIGLMLGTRVKDATAGFRVYRADFLRTLDLGALEATGYGFQVNMTMLVAEAGGRIVEMPISFIERSAGESKLSGSIFTEELRLVTTWGLKKRSAQLSELLSRAARAAQDAAQKR